MTDAELVTAIKDVVLAIAGATTAGVAVFGLKSWSRQLKGTATFEVARGLARATYKLRDEIRSCRSPVLFGNEFPDEYNAAGVKKSPELEARGYAHVYTNRWAPVLSALQEFDTQTLEAEALWGSDLRAKTDQLRTCLRELRAAMDAFVLNAASGGEDFQSDREFGKEIRGILSSTTSEPENGFTSRVDAAVRGIEDEVRPHLRRD